MAVLGTATARHELCVPTDVHDSCDAVACEWRRGRRGQSVAELPGNPDGLVLLPLPRYVGHRMCPSMHSPQEAVQMHVSPSVNPGQPPGRAERCAATAYERRAWHGLIDIVPCRREEVRMDVWTEGFVLHRNGIVDRWTTDEGLAAREHHITRWMDPSSCLYMYVPRI